MSETREALLPRFDREMRSDPPYEPGMRYELADGIVRARGSHNWIVWWRFGAADSEAAVAREVAFFRAIDAPVEWKVYGHDEPANLAPVLERYGFVAAEPETLLVYDLAALPPGPLAPLPAGVEVLPVRDGSGLNDLVAVTAQAFAEEAGWMLDALPQRLYGTDACAAAFVAYCAGMPVAGARIEYARDRAFASLWGGATIPAFRRRGIFAALVSLRVDRARGAGYRYVTVDARETSRPSLERLGFRALSSIVGWDFDPSDPQVSCTETPARAIESHTV